MGRKTLKKIYDSSQENSSKDAEMDSSLTSTSAIDKIKSEPTDEDETSRGHVNENNTLMNQTPVAHQRTVSSVSSDKNSMIQQLRPDCLRKEKLKVKAWRQNFSVTF